MQKLIIIVALALAGCASAEMKGYVGQSLQQVMVKRGAPANAFDMGDGRRAFQWVINQSFVMPTNVTTTGNAYGYGNAINYSQNTQITGGQPITSSCAYTMYGRFDPARNLWIMEGYEKPNVMCE